MAVEPTQLTLHIESFVDVSRSSTAQAASLDAVVSLLKNDLLAIETLVREMEMYLTTTDDIIRARGILLLGEVLASLSSKTLDNATVHSLITFFTDRLADWRALRGALVGCLALMRRTTGGIVMVSDAKAFAKSYLQNLQVQALGQHDRKLCFELLESFLERYQDVVSSLGDVLIYGVCEAIDGEKDPECLILTFHIVEVLVQIFSDPCGPLAGYAADLFEILGCYFPIHFTHPKSEEVEVKRDDLSRALMHAFSSTPLFEPFVMPLLLEKLSSSLHSAKVDSLKYLSCCTSKYGADLTAKYAKSIWSSLKDIIYDSRGDIMLPFTLESLDHLKFGENELLTEALSLLAKVIVQNNDLFLSLILGDEEINMVLNTIASYKSYDEIPSDRKQKLDVVGCILYVSVKASVASCNRIFESFFPRLMRTLGISVESASGIFRLDDSSIISEAPNFGSIFLCVELLEACRDLIKGSDDLMLHCISANETWCRLLQCCSSSLSKVFCSTLAESAHDADMYLGVKGLQILAAFPGGYLLVSKLTFEYIMMTLVSIVTLDFNKTFLWKLALKALVHIGSFIHGCNESEKALNYMDIVVERVVSLVSSDDFSMPFQLKLEAISGIGTSGVKYMWKIVQGLNEVMCANMPEVYVNGNLKSAKIMLQLLECYSNELLPWIQKNEGCEEVLLQFLVKMWDQIETCMTFTAGIHAKELLDATMKVMKLAVACCSVESQTIIVDKAFSVLSSSSLPPNESLLVPAQLEQFEIDQGMSKFSSRDEWLHSLFASVIIALRPQTHIPNIKAVLHIFMIILLKGYVCGAQALGSLVNKLSLKINGTDISSDCTVEEAIDIVFCTTLRSSCDYGRVSKGNDSVLTNLCLGATTSEHIQNHAITGLAWIGKGLLMQGHEKVKDITMVFLDCLLPNGRNDAVPFKQGSAENSSERDMHPSVIKCAADAFEILMSDSELCLNRKFHAVIRPLYKQRFYSTIMPILQSLIVKSGPSFSRSMLYRAFAHVVSDTPLIVVLSDAKKLIPSLLDGLTLLSADILDKDIVYSILLVLSGILTDKNVQEAIIENAHIIVKCLTGLIAYPHMMVVRETAIQCLTAMSELPHSRMYPFRIQVLQAMSKALDDPKRVVRKEAVRCRQAWASKSLHL